MMRRIPKQEHDMAKELMKCQIPSAFIAYLLNMSERTVKRRYKRIPQNTARLNQERLTQPQKRAIVQLHHEGTPFTEIAGRTGVKPRTVLNFLVRMVQEGWTVKSCPLCRKMAAIRDHQQIRMCEACHDAAK